MSEQCSVENLWYISEKQLRNAQCSYWVLSIGSYENASAVKFEFMLLGGKSSKLEIQEWKHIHPLFPLSIIRMSCWGTIRQQQALVSVFVCLFSVWFFVVACARRRLALPACPRFLSREDFEVLSRLSLLRSCIRQRLRLWTGVRAGWGRLSMPRLIKISFELLTLAGASKGVRAGGRKGGGGGASVARDKASKGDQRQGGGDASRTELRSDRWCRRREDKGNNAAAGSCLLPVGLWATSGSIAGHTLLTHVMSHWGFCPWR